MAEPYFVTGALGCIGAWVVKLLLERGDQPVVFDLDGDPRRIRDIVDDESFRRISFIPGDLTDFDELSEAVAASRARKIIHLAALQVPFCRADPARGAAVNVLGTVHVFEAAKTHALDRVVYASSAAVYGLADGPRPDENESPSPTTHYGVYKRANEGSAEIYWQDDRIPSVGLRPLTVYGVGRDQGLTSGPTTAMKAAVLGRPWTIGFTGTTDFVYVEDVATAFVRCADDAPDGALVFNLHGDSVDVTRVIDLIEETLGEEARGLVTAAGPLLPVPGAVDGQAIHGVIDLPMTPLAQGAADTIRRFQTLAAQDRLDTRDIS